MDIIKAAFGILLETWWLTGVVILFGFVTGWWVNRERRATKNERIPGRRQLETRRRRNYQTKID